MAKDALGHGSDPRGAHNAGIEEATRPLQKGDVVFQEGSHWMLMGPVRVRNNETNP